MNSPITAYDLGRIPYREALEFQRRAVAERASNARGDAIYFVEHEPVLTVGRAGHPENLLIPESLLKARGVEIGASLLEADKVDLARSLEEKARSRGVRLVLPVDHVEAASEGEAPGKLTTGEAITPGFAAFDIGPRTSTLFGA